jgi:hypothetical protein
MSRLNFKNTALSLLVISIVAGCTSSPPVNNAPVTKASKVETIKIRNDQTVDLGDKDGKSIRLNVSLGDKQKFKIKNQFPTNTSVLPLAGSFLELHLYRTPVSAGPAINLPPRYRYDAPAPTSLSDLSQSGTVSKVIIENPGSTNTLVYKGLQAGFYYYISARVYSPPLDISTKNWYADTNGDSVNPATAIFNIRTPAVPGPGPDTPVDLANIGGNPYPTLGINPTDIITIDNIGVNSTFDENVQIFDLPPTGITDHFSLYTQGSSPKLGNLIPSYGLTHVKLKKLYRNLVGTDVGGGYAGHLGSAYTPGSGMAYYPSAPGGGTAAGYATWYGYYYFSYVGGWGGQYDSFHNWEEYITVDGASQLVINNDDTIGNLYPASSVYIPNNQWDMEVYLMQSLTGDNILGDVTIGTGAYDAGGPESLSPTP